MTAGATPVSPCSGLVLFIESLRGQRAIRAKPSSAGLGGNTVPMRKGSRNNTQHASPTSIHTHVLSHNMHACTHACINEFHAFADALRERVTNLAGKTAKSRA